MVVRISCMYSDYMGFNNHEEGERIQIGSDLISANFMILENEDQDDALNGREGELSRNFDYDLQNGQLVTIVDGKFVPCEDDYRFDCFHRRRDNVAVR